MKLQQFIDRHNLTLTATRTDRNPGMPDFEGDHWKSTLKRPGHRMTLVFSKGYGHRGEAPTCEEVLGTLRSDLFYMDCSIEDFCSEVGFDPDSSKAERTFKALVRQNTKLHKFLGEDLFTELLNCEEGD